MKMGLNEEETDLCSLAIFAARLHNGSFLVHKTRDGNIGKKNVKNLDWFRNELVKLAVQFFRAWMIAFFLYPIFPPIDFFSVSLLPYIFALLKGKIGLATILKKCINFFVGTNEIELT